MDAESLVVEQVGEEPDHVEQGQRDAGSEHPDHDASGTRRRIAGVVVKSPSARSAGS